jgi:hypothetical protein
MISDENQAQRTVNVEFPKQYFVDNLTMRAVAWFLVTAMSREAR